MYPTRSTPRTVGFNMPMGEMPQFKFMDKVHPKGASADPGTKKTPKADVPTDKAAVPTEEKPNLKTKKAEAEVNTDKKTVVKDKTKTAVPTGEIPHELILSNRQFGTKQDHETPQEVPIPNGPIRTPAIIPSKPVRTPSTRPPGRPSQPSGPRGPGRSPMRTPSRTPSQTPLVAKATSSLSTRP